VDAGVLIAAAIAPRGVCGQLLDAVGQEQVHIIVSPQLLAELAREKFRRWRTEPEARQVTGALARMAELCEDPLPQPGLTPDPKDDYLVALARSTAADYLISGDQHLTGLTDPEPPVLTPRQLLDQLKGRP
jgi:putative PIN family toxin of toxin-antitoxin system